MTGVAGLGSAAPAAGPKAAGGSAAKTPADGRSAFAALVSAAGQKGGGKASKPPSGHAATPATAADPALATGLLALAQAATQSAPTSSAAVSASLGDAGDAGSPHVPNRTDRRRRRERGAGWAGSATVLRRCGASRAGRRPGCCRGRIGGRCVRDTARLGRGDGSGRDNGGHRDHAVHDVV